MSGSNIKVVCRFRPSNSREKDEGAKDIISIDPDLTTVKVEVGRARLYCTTCICSFTTNFKYAHRVWATTNLISTKSFLLLRAKKSCMIMLRSQ